MAINIKQQIHIYDMLNARATVTENGVEGYLTYEQMKEVVDYLKEE